MKSKDQFFNEFIRDELPNLRNIVYHIIGNSADTDDVIQNVLIKIYENFERFRVESNFSGYVYRLAVNSAYDFFRKYRKIYETEQSYLELNQGSSDDGNDEEQHNRTLAKMHSAIDSLPGIYREAIVIGYLSEMDSAAAAEKLGCSVNTLYQRIHTAKLLLKDILTEKNRNE